MTIRSASRGAAIVCAAALCISAAAAADTIDFEGLARGEIVTQVFGAGGEGPVGVSGFNPVCAPDTNAAVIFDTTIPASDDDLGSPNETCEGGGPGVGSAGEVGEPTENCEPRGNVLIVHEQCADLSMSPVETPDDVDVLDAQLDFDFSALGTVTVHSITLMDVEAEEPNAELRLYDVDDALIAMIVLPSTGDNGVRVDPIERSGVVRMELILNGSGSVDDIVFTPDDQPECGDGEVNQEGETCDPPGSNEGEPNECRDDCTFCGDDVLDPVEECDDGNNVDGDGCSAFCEIEPECGDGEINQEGETCDPPGSNEGMPNECRDDCTFCGDDVLDMGEECDDGNNVDGDGCSAVCTLEVGAQGCTPGYWRQPHHYDSWMGYAPGDLFDTVFGVDAPGDDTLADAVVSRGGGENALQRHAVAALLNGSSDGVAFFYSVDQVIAIVQDAYASGDFETAKNLLEAQNGDDTECPLN